MKRMATGNDGRVRIGLICVLAVAALAGCQENDPAGVYGGITPAAPQEPQLNLSANQGVPKQPGPPVDPSLLASNRQFGSRNDPFALTGEESVFQNDQQVEGMLAASGNYALYIEPMIEDPGTQEPPFFEPVPAWRLSGVIIGNGVMALLDTGTRVYEIRPGMMVPGTEWQVVAIDSERALMRRAGNKLPKEFEVTLQGPVGGGIRPGAGGAAGGGAGGAPVGGGGGGVLGPTGAGG